MYQVKNGVLYHNGQPEIALGQSYYPSYHEQKVPVPPEGDRLGEMRVDLREMRAAGFNLCRIAALGEVGWADGEVRVDFPLPDAFCRQCEEDDLAAMVRLQGYSMNLRGFDDATMRNERGEEMPFHWSWFVRNSLCHPGIYEDNVAGTRASAKHFDRFPSVVAFQIYNEPAYPGRGLYDYHPYTVTAWRKWLEEEKRLPAEEARAAEPPRQRPAPGEDPQRWMWWREFHMQRMTGFLCDMGRRAKEGYPLPETLTCHRTDPFQPGNAIHCEDYFQTAEGMDILGFTHYIPCRGPEYHRACQALDGAEAAAALQGKHAWLVEYNARTNMPPVEWERETYAALGRGIKGILYYQWRADYPYPGSPEPEGFGLMFNDRRKTPVFDTAVAMNRLVNRWSGLLAQAEKARSGLGLLYSHDAIRYYDAQDNVACDGAVGAHERYVLALRAAYRGLNAQGLVADCLRACDLARNALGIRVLILPMLSGLSEAERTQVEAFRVAGGKVYVYHPELDCYGVFHGWEEKRLHGIVFDEYDAASLAEKEQIPVPARVINAPLCDARLLCGPAGDAVCLCNYDPLERPVTGGVLRLSGKRYTRALVCTPGAPEGVALPVEEGRVNLPDLRAGALIILS